jgi:hypothetical protein
LIHLFSDWLNKQIQKIHLFSDWLNNQIQKTSKNMHVQVVSYLLPNVSLLIEFYADSYVPVLVDYILCVAQRCY